MEELVRLYRQMVLRVVFGILGDLSAADDVAQEVFLKAHRHIASLESEAARKAWVYRVAVNQAIDFLRKTRRYREVSFDFDVHGVVSEGGDAHSKLERAETVEMVRRAIDSLPTEQRIVLVLRELEGMNYEEIAAILGIALGTVESRLFRARKALKVVLSRLMEKENV